LQGAVTPRRATWLREHPWTLDARGARFLADVCAVHARYSF
jgi:hypothetical protein